MIRDTSGQDRPLAKPTVGRPWRRWLSGGALAIAVIAGIGYVVRGWLGAERSADRSRIRIATVERGTLVRDIVADGRVVAANSPTLYAIAAGTVDFHVRAGDKVTRGQALATIASPELQSRLTQEQATMAGLEAGVGRAELDVEHGRANAQRLIAQAEVDRQGAAREVEINNQMFAKGVIPELELRRSEDALQKAEIAVRHAHTEAGLAGKELVFDLGPFVTLNCGALPSELLEAELFGAEVGAYTGASRAREGKFESADGGTLFLDEIGNLSANGQMKLLRVLETGRFERLGSNRERQVKVRVISATNADLHAMIRAGTFREDLYYRLNTIEIRVPPLAERVDDILPLARSFLAAGLAPGKRLSADAREALRHHSWPGNVRELRNALQRAALLATGPEITAADLALSAAPPRFVPGGSGASASHPGHPGPPGLPGTSDDEPDRAAIEAALARAGGVIAQAAAELGLSRQALYRRMEKLSVSTTPAVREPRPGG
jgi:transcriptional regulator of acetoin/glycerol metabolism